MGPVITINSSTLMNKGQEVIEAHELFGVDYDQIEVVGEKKVAQFARTQTGQEQGQEDGELPVVARAEEYSLLVRGEEFDRAGRLDGDAVDLDRQRPQIHK